MVVADLACPQRPMTAAPPRPGLFARWLRAPLLHFTLIGGAVYLASSGIHSQAAAPIVLTPSDIASLRSDWSRSTGRAPSEGELERLIQQFAADEILIRKARALGWEQGDAVIQQRLIRNLRFLDPDSEESDGELLKRAYAMGMHERDLVVRRRLLERMKLAVAAQVRSEPIDEQELKSHRLAHAEALMRPPLIRMTQIYLSRDLRGPTLGDDIALLAERLRGEQTSPEDAVQLADPFLISANLPLWSPARLSDRLGPDFAEGVQEAPLAAWSEPVESSYGAHVVWVHDRIPALLPPLAEIRTQLIAEIYREREEQALAEFVSKLREGVEVQVANSTTTQGP